MVEPNQQANGQLRKVPDQLPDDWNRGVLFVRSREQDFVSGVVLAAETGEVLVGLAVEPPHRLEDAERRREVVEVLPPAAEESPRGTNCRHVVDERRGGPDQNRPFEYRPQHSVNPLREYSLDATTHNLDSLSG